MPLFLAYYVKEKQTCIYIYIMFIYTVYKKICIYLHYHIFIHMCTLYNYRSLLLFGWKFGFVPHGCQSIIFSDAHYTYSLTTSVFFWSTCCFFVVQWLFLLCDPFVLAFSSHWSPIQGETIGRPWLQDDQHPPPARDMACQKKWMQPIPQWLHEPGDTMGTGAKRACPKVFMWASWFPWLSFSMFCLWEWTHQKIQSLLGHFFVNSCALKFTLCLSPPAFLIYSTLSTE